jgi:hypothetical protein
MTARGVFFVVLLAVASGVSAEPTTFYCFGRYATSVGELGGTCERTLAACTTTRQMLANAIKDGTPPKCKPQKGAWCFRFSNVNETAERESCWMTADFCDAMRLDSLKHRASASAACEPD